MTVAKTGPFNLCAIGLLAVGQGLMVSSSSLAESSTAANTPICAEFTDSGSPAWPIGFTYLPQVLCIDSGNVLAWRFDHIVEAIIKLPFKQTMISQRFFIKPKMELEEGRRVLAAYGGSPRFFEYEKILQDLVGSVVATTPRMGLLDSGLTHSRSLDLLKSIGWASEVKDHERVEVWIEDQREDNLTGLVFCSQSHAEGTDRINACTYILFSESLMVYVSLSPAEILDTEESRNILRHFVSSRLKNEPSERRLKRLEQQEISVTMSGKDFLFPVKYLVKYLKFSNRERGFQAVILKGEVLHGRQEVEPIRRISGRSDDVDQRSVSVIFALNEEFNATVNTRGESGIGETERCQKWEESAMKESSYCRANFILVPGVQVEFFYGTTVATDFNHIKATVHQFLENMVQPGP